VGNSWGHGSGRSPRSFPQARPDPFVTAVMSPEFSTGETRPLKSPVWTWEIPVYFFVGGAAGAAAVIVLAGRLSGADPTLVRDARLLAAGGALLSPILLISDLGRPARFLNMLRVFKVQSPMSIGAWTLVAFSTSVFGALAAEWSRNPALASPALGAASLAGDVAAALTGLLLATYTGVLIGATVIPVWSQHAPWLPVIFGASALGSAVSILEVAGHLDASLSLAGLGAAVMETAAALHMGAARRRDGLQWPRRAGRMADIGALLTGPVPLVLRISGYYAPPLRLAAAIGTIGGALMTRVGWMSAGKRPL
jgi:hypothetical protein